jgi:hypothetical protein
MRVENFPLIAFHKSAAPLPHYRRGSANEEPHSFNSDVSLIAIRDFCLTLERQSSDAATLTVNDVIAQTDCIVECEYKTELSLIQTVY